MNDVRRAGPGEHPRWIQNALNADTDACLLWPFVSRNRQGYGTTRHMARTWLAHRLVLSLAVGPGSCGAKVLHSCDMPACCNPRHLRWGTHADNMADCVQRGRTNAPSGPDHYRIRTGRFARLSPDDVRAIRASTGSSVSQLAARFGVARPTIRDVLTRRSWRYLDG